MISKAQGLVTILCKLIYADLAQHLHNLSRCNNYASNKTIPYNSQITCLQTIFLPLAPILFKHDIVKEIFKSQSALGYELNIPIRHR